MSFTRPEPLIRTMPVVQGSELSGLLTPATREAYFAHDVGCKHHLVDDPSILADVAAGEPYAAWQEVNRVLKAHGAIPGVPVLIELDW